MSQFGPAPGAPPEDARTRRPAYLPPGGLSGTPAGVPSRRGGVVRGPQRTLLVTSHKPGIISLRPMGLGDLVDGSVKHVRRNAGAVFAATVIVLAVSAVPAVLVAALGSRGSWYDDVGADAVLDRDSFFGLLLTLGAGFAALVLTGALAYSVGEATLGRRPDLGELWHAVRRRLLPLVGLAVVLTLAVAVPVVLLVVLVALLAGADAVALAVLLALAGGVAVAVWTLLLVTRTCVAGPVVVLERRSVGHALRRSWALTRGAVWRTLLRLVVVGALSGVVLLVVQLVLLGVGSLLRDALSVGVSLDAFLTSLTLAVATLLAVAVVVPFVAGAQTLVYVDQRMRLEGFDLVLQRAARSAGGSA